MFVDLGDGNYRWQGFASDALSSVRIEMTWFFVGVFVGLIMPPAYRTTLWYVQGLRELKVDVLSPSWKQRMIEKDRQEG